MVPERQLYVREAHPEVAFATLHGRAMLHHKRAPDGRIERLTVLSVAGIVVSEARLREERSQLRAAEVGLDDIVDALVCLIVAFHIHSGRSQSLGRTNQRDDKGLLMEIVTCAAVARAVGA